MQELPLKVIFKVQKKSAELSFGSEQLKNFQARRCSDASMFDSIIIVCSFKLSLTEIKEIVSQESKGENIDLDLNNAVFIDRSIKNYTNQQLPTPLRIGELLEENVPLHQLFQKYKISDTFIIEICPKIIQVRTYINGQHLEIKNQLLVDTLRDFYYESGLNQKNFQSLWLTNVQYKNFYGKSRNIYEDICRMNFSKYLKYFKKKTKKKIPFWEKLIIGSLFLPFFQLKINFFKDIKINYIFQKIGSFQELKDTLNHNFNGTLEYWLSKHKVNIDFEYKIFQKQSQYMQSFISELKQQFKDRKRREKKPKFMLIFFQ